MNRLGAFVVTPEGDVLKHRSEVVDSIQYRDSRGRTHVLEGQHVKVDHVSVAVIYGATKEIRARGARMILQMIATGELVIT